MFSVVEGFVYILFIFVIPTDPDGYRESGGIFHPRDIGITVSGRSVRHAPGAAQDDREKTFIRLSFLSSLSLDTQRKREE